MNTTKTMRLTKEEQIRLDQIRRLHKSWRYCGACGRELGAWRYGTICLVCQDWASSHGFSLAGSR